MTFARAALLLLPLLVVSCSSPSPKETPQQAKEPKPPAEPVGGRLAFQRTFITARTWAQDLQLLRIRSVTLGDAPAAPGKSAAWEVTFVSPAKSRVRAYVYSVIERDNVHEGVFAQPEDVWSGSSGQATPFSQAALKTDSVEAYETAAAKSKDYIKKFPDRPVIFLLEKTPRHPDPTWRVIWGDSVGTSDYSIFVDATTGQYLERMR